MKICASDDQYKQDDKKEQCYDGNQAEYNRCNAKDAQCNEGWRSRSIESCSYQNPITSFLTTTIPSATEPLPPGTGNGQLSIKHALLFRADLVG
jgi:hypothetical protein